MTNEEPYKNLDQRPVSEEIKRRQLKFIGHCLRVTAEEPANIYALYESRMNKTGRPNAKYIEQISEGTRDKKIRLTTLEEYNMPITRRVGTKWLPNLKSSPDDDDDDDRQIKSLRYLLLLNLSM